MTDNPYYQKLLDIGAVNEGHFCLTPKNGVQVHSGHYVDKDSVGKAHPTIEDFCLGMAQDFRDSGIDVVVGPAQGGLAFANGIAQLLGTAQHPVLATFVHREGEDITGGDSPFVIKRGFDKDIQDAVVGIVAPSHQLMALKSVVAACHPENIAVILPLFGEDGVEKYHQDPFRRYPLAESKVQMVQPFSKQGVDVVVGTPFYGITDLYNLGHELCLTEKRLVKTVYAEYKVDVNRANPMVLPEGVAELIRGKRVLAVEDICTSGGSAKRMIEAIMAADPAQIVALTIIFNRGNVQPGDVWNVPVRALANQQMESWPASTCPLCKDKQPLRVDLGKGLDWLETPEGQAWLEAGGLVAA